MLMGAFSRAKGVRGERGLVLYLASRYYKAERILNQAHTKGLPDVKAWKGDNTYTFELKTYRDSFTAFYKLYSEQKDPDGVLRLAVDLNSLLAVSTDFEALAVRQELPFRMPDGLPPKDRRVIGRLWKMREKKGTADFLVLKDNNKPRLFIKYWA